MIKNFGDHAANERTFLAWVRTAIAVMTFGFVVEKFDLFLEFTATSLAGRTLSMPGQKFGNVAGLVLIVLGIVMVAIAAIRFLITTKNIDSEDLQHGAGSRIDVALATLLVLLGSALFIYLSDAIVATKSGRQAGRISGAARSLRSPPASPALQVVTHAIARLESASPSEIAGIVGQVEPTRLGRSVRPLPLLTHNSERRVDNVFFDSTAVLVRPLPCREVR
jgi:putative membrane protein